MRIEGESIETMDGVIIAGTLSRTDGPQLDLNGHLMVQRILVDALARIARAGCVRSVVIELKTNVDLELETKKQE